MHVTNSVKDTYLTHNTNYKMCVCVLCVCVCVYVCAVCVCASVTHLRQLSCIKSTNG